MNAKVTILVILAIFVSAGCISISGDTEDSNADTTPAQHVATLGSSFTSTVVYLGAMDKIVLIDTGSISYAPGYKGDTVSTANYADVAAKLDVLVHDGKWDKNTDVVITYGYTSAAKLKILTDEGYKVLTPYPKTYAETVDYVETIETALGIDHRVSTDMKSTMDSIEDRMSTYTGEKVSTIYVSYTSKQMKIGNTGITASMIDVCGAVNAGASPGKGTAYEPPEGTGAFLTKKISEGVKIILLDGTYSGTESEFISEVGISGATVFKLDPLWNSYTPEIEEGLTTISKYLYPEIFGSADGGSDSGSPGDYMIYALAIIAVLVIIGIIYFVRRPNE